MAEQNGQGQSSKAMRVVPVAALAIVIAAAVAWRVLHVSVANEGTTKPVVEANVPSPPPSAGEPPIIVAKEVAPQPITRAQVTIDDIVQVRKYWNPAFTEWFGKQAPNFDLTDVEGKDHKLSNYKGKAVMLVFWATWCGPCRQEIPGLIALRKEFSPDKLAIIAISFEKGDVVRDFLKQKPVNYTVITAPQDLMSPPFSMVNGIPATFFIDKEGVIRLASEGLVLENEAKMILKVLDS
ncbi:MAG TPA: TlpA disulfide reductase family protein [Methylococcales bacterium]